MSDKRIPITQDAFRRLMRKLGHCPQCREKIEATYRVVSESDHEA